MSSEYAGGGTVGIGTPQANPTVEAEMAILLPRDVLRLTTRLTSSAPASEQRLRDYLERIEAALATFDTLRLDVFGFACTASSYLVGAAREAEIVAAAETQFGYPVVTAATAITARLRELRAKRIALVSPYPPALSEAALAFWTAQGFAPILAGSVGSVGEDTRDIYGIDSNDARDALASATASDVDAILITGTGMPSLRLLAAASDGPPILSSNLALAEALLARLGRTLPDWRGALADATGTRS